MESMMEKEKWCLRRDERRTSISFKNLKTVQKYGNNFPSKTKESKLNKNFV